MTGLGFLSGSGLGNSALCARYDDGVREVVRAQGGGEPVSEKLHRIRAFTSSKFMIRMLLRLL